MFPNQNIYDPRAPMDMNNINNDNFFVSVDQYKKKRCHQNCIKRRFWYVPDVFLYLVSIMRVFNGFSTFSRENPKFPPNIF